MAARPARLAILGFDCDAPLTQATAERFAQHGYEFVLRYVPRLVHHAIDLTRDERDAIHAGGLGLMCVQHVEAGRWTPSRDKGKAYGKTAVEQCRAIGVALGTSIWLDLESVADGVPHEITIGYCNAWFAEVRAAGFTPSLYVGWRCGLTPTELYQRLTCRAYWSALNLDRDEFPIVRGVQMRQREAKHGVHHDDYPVGIGFEIDIDVVTGDAFHNFPMIDFGDLL